MSIDLNEIDRRFNHHPPDTDRIEKHQGIRTAFKYVAQVVVVQTPSSREQSLAITALEEAAFWANAAIARQEKVPA